MLEQMDQGEAGMNIDISKYRPLKRGEIIKRGDIFSWMGVFDNYKGCGNFTCVGEPYDPTVQHSKHYRLKGKKQ